MYYFKNFQTWQSFWALFFSLSAFLFILYKADFIFPEVKQVFIFYYWGYSATAGLFGLISGGLLRIVGIDFLELGDKKIINNNVNRDGSIIDSISDKELLELYDKIKEAPILLLKRFLIFGSGLGIISVMAAGVAGASMSTILLLSASTAVAFLLSAFFGILLGEVLSSPLLRECKRKIYQRDLSRSGNEIYFFSLKNRIYYFIFLFFILLVISLTAIKEITPIMLVFSFLSLLMIIITARVLFSSIYLVFKEVEDFAFGLSTFSQKRHLTGSSFKEVISLSEKLNESAEKLYAGRKKEEKEKEKVSAIINNFTGPIIFIDAENRISLFNAAASKVLGMSLKDYGKKITNSHNFALADFKKVIHKKYKKKQGEKEEGKRSSSKKRDLQEEVIELKYQGKQRIYRVQTSLVYDEDESFCGIIKIFYDLTTEEEINKAKSNFISIAAHQLRTPLSGIKWIINMILDEDMGKINKEQEKLLEKAYNSNQKIIDLIDDLLNISRIEEGRFGYKIGKKNFNDLMNEVLDDFYHKIESKNIEFNFNKPKKDIFVYMDKEKMRLVLQNIIDNAIKYTPVGGKVEILIKKERNFLETRVKDSGVGIPEEDKNKIFSKFYRAGNVSKSDISGSGLGLFIAKNIIEKHGGEIELESEKDKGTEIIFKLPIDK
ncbi:MAG: ATP-binding protein [Patescibacteria group bacterium]